MIDKLKKWVEDNIFTQKELTPEEVTEMFTLNNEVMPDKAEYGRTCSACKNKVRQNLIDKYYENKSK